MQETEATKLTDTVLNHADKKLSSSLYDVLGLTVTDESKSLIIVRNVAVGKGAIALHKLLVEYQPRHRQPSLGSAHDDHELDDSCDRSDHCCQRAGFENHCLRIAER